VETCARVEDKSVRVSTRRFSRSTSTESCTILLEVLVNLPKVLPEHNVITNHLLCELAKEVYNSLGILPPIGVRGPRGKIGTKHILSNWSDGGIAKVSIEGSRMGRSHANRTVVFLNPKPFIKHTRTARMVAVIWLLNAKEAPRVIGFRRRASLVLPVLWIRALE